MGQTYDVTFDLKVKDRQKLIDELNAFVDETNGKSINWDIDNTDRTSLNSLMKAVITDRGFFSIVEDGNEPAAHFSSAFDACYGWEGVMMNTFEVMAPFLKDGSTCEIWPDSGVDRGKVKNGKVVWK